MTDQPPLFPMDYGMFRFLLGWEGNEPPPKDWTKEHLEMLSKIDTHAELHKWWMIMTALVVAHTKDKTRQDRVHVAELIEAAECSKLLHALCDILLSKTTGVSGLTDSEKLIVDFAESNPEVPIILAFTAGQLSVVAFNRAEEKQYARGKTRYDNLKAANAAKGKPSPDDEFLNLYQKSQSLFDTQGRQVKWLMQQLNLSRSQVYKRIKTLKQK